MPTHQVKQGECMLSIAAQYGFSWGSLWNHSGNSALKQLRKDPNVLFPGDEVVIPQREEKEESCPTDARHRFKTHSASARLKVRVLVNDQPRANEPYSLVIDGQWTQGTTTHDGFVEEKIAPGAKGGRLIVGSGTSQDVFEFQLGTVDPLDTAEGVQKRLIDLGYAAGGGPARAIAAFQARCGLDVTGAADDATRNKLKEKFGQ